MKAKQIGRYVVYADQKEVSVNFYIYNDLDEDVEITAVMTTLPHNKPIVTGFVKWDACSHWHFPITPNTTHPLHFDDKLEAIEFGEMLAKCYDWAAELLPKHRAEILNMTSEDEEAERMGKAVGMFADAFDIAEGKQPTTEKAKMKNV